MDNECRSIRSQALNYGWHMRGGASYEDILNMSQTERELIADLIEANLETTKKTGQPFF